MCGHGCSLGSKRMQVQTQSGADLAVMVAPPAQPLLSGTPSPRYVWYVVILLSVVNVFSYMDRMALSVLLPFIKADLQLSDAQLGLLVGFAFFLFYAICGIPI